ncbi:MAG: pyridoxamine 5'-phosphate oxidase family protein [Daejeonella sp.]|uniref:pyridoxamine 5'-phosphate oxidase family protein n=1 Tax=Daejeonella sp. TaxID=2805397 RepID=UPI002735D2F6|nr:pyridoxamine 5'-phosphate oxidase family protein [Daejeonella sp.]MDP3469559.1 pyridoxamine 5'-phosphate oxidase family protein [Daejeonella sp.]
MVGLITPEIINAFNGIIPPTIATASADGIPNITYISRLQYVDESHIALSWQFFNKTWKNIAENPKFAVCVTCPATGKLWQIKLSYVEHQTSGDIFDEMSMVIDLIASLQGSLSVFKLAAAVICEVEAVNLVYDGSQD